MSSASSRVAENQNTEIKLIDRFKTLRRMRSKASQRLAAPAEQMELRHKLHSQAALADSFSMYLKRLEALFSEVQKAHDEFVDKMEQPGLNPEAWPELPHNAVYSFKIVIGKLSNDLANLWTGSLDRLRENFATCQSTLDRTDELAWQDLRYEKKLKGLSKNTGPVKTQKIIRNEEKHKLVKQEHEMLEERLAEQLSDLTTKQREDEQNQICTLLDGCCKHLQDFGTGLSETRRHIKSNVKAGPRGWEGFLKRSVDSAAEKRKGSKEDNTPSEKSKFQKSKEEWEERKRQRQQQLRQQSTNPFNNDLKDSSLSSSDTSSDSDDRNENVVTAGKSLRGKETNPFSPE